MEFGIPAGYVPRVDPATTRQYVRAFHERFFKNCLAVFDCLPVVIPATVTAVSGLHVLRRSREIAFDTRGSAEVYQVLNSPENYLRRELGRWEFGFQQGLAASFCVIERDALQTATAPVNSLRIYVEKKINAADAQQAAAFLKTQIKLALNVVGQTVLELSSIHKPRLTLPFDPGQVNIAKIVSQYRLRTLEDALAIAVQRSEALIVDNLYSVERAQQFAGEARKLTSVDLAKTATYFHFDRNTLKPLRLIEAAVRPDALTVAANQERYAGRTERSAFVEAIQANTLPATFGIEIDVSLLLLSLLEKMHAAEVVSSPWPTAFTDYCAAQKVEIC